MGLLTILHDSRSAIQSWPVVPTTKERTKHMLAKVLRTYKKLSDGALSEKAQHVHDVMVAGGSFPTSVMTALAFQGTIDVFNTNAAAAVGGSTTDTANKNNARVQLISNLDALADWVDANSGGDSSFILANGFDPSATSRSAVVLGVPVLQTLTNYANTKLKLTSTVVTGATGYEAQTSVGAGAWSNSIVFTSSRNMILENLTPGTIYNVRVRAFGGNNQHGEWSGVISQMCT